MSGVDTFKLIRGRQHIGWRAYDKALEQNRAVPPPAPGEWHRVERQLRWSGKSRPMLGDVLEPGFLSGAWSDPFKELLTPAHTPTAAAAHLAASVAAERLEHRVAARLAGVIALSASDPRVAASAASTNRDRKLLAELGISRVAANDASPATRALLAAGIAALGDMSAGTDIHTLGSSWDDELI